MYIFFPECFFLNLSKKDQNSYVYEMQYQLSSVTQLCVTLCDPMDCSMPGFPVHHQLPKVAQTHGH